MCIKRKSGASEERGVSRELEAGRGGQTAQDQVEEQSAGSAADAADANYAQQVAYAVNRASLFCEFCHKQGCKGECMKNTAGVRYSASTSETTEIPCAACGKGKNGCNCPESTTFRTVGLYITTPFAFVFLVALLALWLIALILGAAFKGFGKGFEHTSDFFANGGNNVLLWLDKKFSY